MEEFPLDDLSDPGRRHAFDVWAEGRRKAGDRLLQVRIRGASDVLADGLAWRDRLASCEPLPVQAILDDAVFVHMIPLFAVLAWLGAVTLACEERATVWMGGWSERPYTGVWHDVRDYLASRIRRTSYQEHHAYPLRTAIGLLLGTEMIGPKRLGELHGAETLPARRIQPATCPPEDPDT